MTEAEAARHLTAAQGFVELGETEEAWRQLDDLPPEVQASKPALVLRLRILLDQQEWEKLGILAESMTGYAGELFAPWYCLAIVRVQQGDVEAARLPLKRALEINPEARESALNEPLLEGVW